MNFGFHLVMENTISIATNQSASKIRDTILTGVSERTRFSFGYGIQSDPVYLLYSDNNGKIDFTDVRPDRIPA